jgi:hypothetical protein
VPVWQALGPGSASGVEPVKAPRVELIGRAAEQSLLEAALARARIGRRPQLALVVGVPGIGKSRLVSEFAQQVAAGPGPGQLRQGRCLPYGEGVALWALGEIVKGQAGILETDPVEAAANKLLQAVTNLVANRPEAAWVTSHLRPLVGLSAAGEASSDRRVEAFAAWRRFLEALAGQRPTVLVRDVAYAQLPRGQRADKHQKAAEWIEALSLARSANCWTSTSPGGRPAASLSPRHAQRLPHHPRDQAQTGPRQAATPQLNPVTLD